MKKIICISLALVSVLLSAGCSKSGGTAAKNNSSVTGVADLLTTAPASPSGSQSGTAAPNKKSDELKKESTSAADLDLTGLNANLVYSGIYDLVTKSDEYTGKTVKISGTFQPFTDPSTNITYFNCYVADAAACCQQGIEFVLTDDYAYPADYPAEGEDITIYGTFETYIEGENMYCHLKDAVFTD